MNAAIPAAILKAALETAATKDVRYYLRALFVEFNGVESRIVSTNGTILGAYRLPLPPRQDGDPTAVLLPVEAVKLALAGKSASISLVRDVAGWTLGSIRFTPVDGRFPDWRRVVPAQTSGEAGYYDPELLMKFVKAARALGVRSSPVVRQSGMHGSALVQFVGYPDFVGVAMSIRFTEKAPDPELPTWPWERPA